MLRSSLTRPAALMAAAGLIGALAACDSDRTAEADTPVSEAEVSTELPEDVVSDRRLEAAANAAANVAGSPPAEVIAIPVPSGPAQTNTATAAPTNTTNTTSTTNTTGR